MFAAGFGGVIATVFVQHRQYDESKRIETESGTGNKPALERIPVFAVKSSEHTNSPTQSVLEFVLYVKNVKADLFSPEWVRVFVHITS